MRKYFLILTLLVFIRVIGQPAGQNVSNPDLPNLIPPSPSVSSLIKFEEMPVNYYTGIPSINEELAKVPINGNLNLSIALDYHPTGVRIEEYASWVGTGWSLNGIGGFVSRTTKGAPDELGGILSNNYYNSSFVTNFNLFDQINYDSYYLGTGKYSDFDHDTMSDIFHFNFFGESGKFIFSKNSSGVIVPTLLDRKSNIKIQVIQSSQLGIDSFVLTNDTGYKFTFDIKEISTIYTNNVSLLRGGGNISVGGSTIFYPTSWHLSKVETSSGVLLCTFDYHPDIIESTKTFSYSKNDVYKHDIDIFNTNGVSPDLHNMLPFSSYTETTINVASKKVSKISITGKAEILFNVTLGRTDYENNTGCSLESIVVKDFQGNQISKFALEYQTFGTGNRLFLKELKKYGNDNNSFNPYLFLYKNPDLLPDKRSYSKDYWGYFNSYRNMEPYPAIPFLGTIGSDARTNKNVVATGSLNKIIYPNGGYKKIDFESNTYSKTATLSKEYYDQPENKNVINESMALNGNPNQSVSTNYKIIYIENGDFINFNLTPTFINQTWQGTANINAYRVNLTPLIPDYNFDPQNSQIIQDLSQYTFDVDQNYVDAIRPSYKLSMQDCSGQNGNSCIKTFYLKGFYLVQLGFNGDMPQMNDLVNYNISFQWHRYVENLKFNYGGGLRVKSIEYYDAIDDSHPSRKYSYNYDSFVNSAKSSGSIINIPVHAYYQKRKWASYILPPSNMLAVRETYYVTTSSKSMVPYTSTNGSIVGYKNVKVTDSYEGFKRFYYNSPEDFPEPEHAFSYPYTNEAPNHDFKRGLLLKEEVFNSNNQPVKIIENSYDYNEVNVLGGWNVFLQQYNDCHIHRSHFGEFVKDHTHYIATVNNPNTEFQMKSSLCNNMYTFLDIKEQLYIRGWAKLTSTLTKDYFYEGSTPKIVSTNQYYTYNNVNFKIETQHLETSQGENLTTKYFYPSDPSMSGKPVVTQLTAKHMIGVPLVTETYRNTEKLSTQETVYKNWGTTNNPLLLPELVKTSKGSGDLEIRLRYQAYDSQGNLTQVRTEQGLFTSYIWGYNKTLPIAKLDNMTNAAVATATGIAFNDLNESHMATINSIRTNGAYSNGQITTLTYKPLVGVTSVTDPKNQTTTYEYDSFGRLQRVKDHQGNILSENEYHYRTQN